MIECPVCRNKPLRCIDCVLAPPEELDDDQKLALSLQQFSEQQNEDEGIQQYDQR